MVASTKTTPGPVVGEDLLMPLGELTKLLVKHHGFREGIFDISVEFQIGVGSIGPDPEKALFPSAIASVSRVGLKRVDKEGASTIDAASLWPPTKRVGRKRSVKG